MKRTTIQSGTNDDSVHPSRKTGERFLAAGRDPLNRAILAVVFGQDRPRLEAKWLRFFATFNANITQAVLYTSSYGVATLIADMRVSAKRTYQMTRAIPNFQRLTKSQMSRFDIRDAEILDPVDRNIQRYEIATCIDDKPGGAADQAHVLSHYGDIRFHAIERFRIPPSPIIQARQRFVFEPYSEWKRDDLIKEMEKLVSHRNYQGALLVPPRPVESLLW